MKTMRYPWSKEARRRQSSNALINTQVAFKRLVDEILHDIRPSSNIRIGPSAISTLQDIAEGKIVDMFKCKQPRPIIAIVWN